MWRHTLTSVRILLVFTVLTGLLYPAIVTGLCRVFFPKQAAGSLIEVGGTVLGSELIAQNFTKPEYLHPRPSGAGSNGYDPTASSPSNLGPTNKALINRIEAAAAKFRQENPDFSGPIPADLLASSGSGLDPHLSPASALAQADRIAKARGTSADRIRAIITANIEPPTLGVLGEPRVNVLKLNLLLDEQFPIHK